MDSRGQRGTEKRRLFRGSGVVTGASGHQCGDEGPEQGFTAPPGVVNELEEAQVNGKPLLRDAAVRAQPGAQQRPEAFDGVDVDLAEAITIVVARVLAAGMDVVFVGMDQGAGDDLGFDDWLDRRLLKVGQHVQDHFAAALDQTGDRRLLLLQGAAATLALQPAPPGSGRRGRCASVRSSPARRLRSVPTSGQSAGSTG